MILKEIDSKNEEIQQLNKLSKICKNQKIKKSIQLDLVRIKNGYESEKNNAYYLDFISKDSKRHYLLHDIRIEYNGRVAQIDHLIISRLGIELLESKSFSGILTINQDGSLSVDYGKSKKTFPNPTEQNKRHAKVLIDFINSKIELPSNIKLFGGIPIETKVLINPKTTISNKTLPDGFVRTDSFFTIRDSESEKMSTISAFKSLGKIMTLGRALEIAKLLIKFHKPHKIDYSKKYNITIDYQPIGQNKCMQAFIKEEVLSKKVDICRQVHNEIALCSKCKSPNLEIRYGKYGYYFKCLFCNGNTSLHLTCKTEKCKPRLRKKKLKFYKVCDICKTEELFFENKPS